MTSFMFACELPSEFTPEMALLLPQHREHINRLFLKGTVVSYSVSKHRNAIWCVVTANDEQEALELVAGFPLHPYFTEVLCHPLMFHNAIPHVLPEISLN